MGLKIGKTVGFILRILPSFINWAKYIALGVFILCFSCYELNSFEFFISTSGLLDQITDHYVFLYVMVFPSHATSEVHHHLLKQFS